MAGSNDDDVNDMSSPIGTRVPAGMQSIGLLLLHLYIKEGNIIGVNKERRFPSGETHGEWRFYYNGMET